MAEDESGNLTRIRSWVIMKTNGRKGKPANEYQRGCPEIIPGLRGKEFWDAGDVPWLARVEEQHQGVLEELMALRGKTGFQVSCCMYSTGCERG